jgi:hypothetical protein
MTWRSMKIQQIVCQPESRHPHVTIGVGTVDYLNALVAAPFPTLLRSFKLMQ